MLSIEPLLWQSLDEEAQTMLLAEKYALLDIATIRKTEREEGRAEEHKAIVKKLSQNYLDNKKAATMEDAIEMAESILGK